MSHGDEPLRLQGAQQRLAAAYTARDDGLYTLDCVAGAGKSVVVTDLAARTLLERWVDGDRAPEQRLCCLSFARDDAATLTAAIVDRVRTLVAHDMTPAAAAVDETELAAIVACVRVAPHIGTVDSFIQSIFESLVGELGFAEPPSVGNAAALGAAHRACLERLEADPALAGALERLRDAYPDDEYDKSVATVLRQARQYCLRQRCSVASLHRRLRRSVAAVYPTGDPADADTLRAAIQRCVPGPVTPSLPDTNLAALVAADGDLRRAWVARIDDLCSLLSAYITTYGRACRARGVVSHTDRTALVAAALDTGPEPEASGGDRVRDRDGVIDSWLPDGDLDTDSERVDRVRARHGAIDVWLLDEAQDIARLQHAALAPLVAPTDQVVVAGDRRQSIYSWRDADPALYVRAIERGEYLGIDWTQHVTETATRTYRLRPALCDAVQAVAGQALADPARGQLGQLAMTPPTFEPVRDATAEPAVHIPAIRASGAPWQPSYLTPGVDTDTDGEPRTTRGGNTGEATMLARYLVAGLADGTVDPPADEPVLVLFRRRTHMPAYRAAFEAVGLRVGSARTPLFETSPVRAVVAICELLAALRGRTDRAGLLAEADDLGISSVVSTLREHDWVLADAHAAAAEQVEPLLDALERLAEQTRGQPQSARSLGATVTGVWGLRADQHEVVPATTAATREQALDALEAWLGELDDVPTPAALVTQVRPLVATPSDGPSRPLDEATDPDVVFKTVHQAKGDEAAVVALADVGSTLGMPGPVHDRFITAGEIAALAPPETGNVPEDSPLGPFQGGLYRPAVADAGAGLDRERGLRWVTEQWVEDTTAAEGEADAGDDAGSNSTATAAESGEPGDGARGGTRDDDQDAVTSGSKQPEVLTGAAGTGDVEQAGSRVEGGEQGRHTQQSHAQDGSRDRDRDRGRDRDQDRPALLGPEPLQRVVRARRAEEWRVLYVALTRARDHLIVPLPATGRDSRSPRDSWLPTLLAGLDYDGGSDDYARPAVGAAASFAVGVNDAAYSLDMDSQTTAGIQPLAGTTPPDRAALPALVPRVVRPSTLASLLEAPTDHLLRHLLTESLATPTAATASTLPFDTAAVDPDVLGTATHELVHTLARRGHSPAQADDLIDAVLKQHLDDCTTSTRQQVAAWLETTVCQQLHESDCWQQITTADRVMTESPLPGHPAVDDIRFELDGAADILLDTGAGWHVIELKLTLGDLRPATRDRYTHQAATYKALLAPQVDGPVTASVEAVGASRASLAAAGSPERLRDQLRQLVNRCDGHR
jgi:ATP-dependent helicase/nuclease subunit A